MGRMVINVVLLAGILALVGLGGLGGGERAERNFEFFPDMARTARSNAFSSNEVLPGRMTMQPPVAGTVRIDAADWAAIMTTPPTREKDVEPKGSESMDNPFAGKGDAVAARGKLMYETYCGPCHGNTGVGDGPVTKRGYPEPPSLIEGGASGMSDLDVYRVITFGGTEMPAYAVQMTPSDRWKAILHLRTLQGAGGVN